MVSVLNFPPSWTTRKMPPKQKKGKVRFCKEAVNERWKHLATVGIVAGGLLVGGGGFEVEASVSTGALLEVVQDQLLGICAVDQCRPVALLP